MGAQLAGIGPGLPTLLVMEGGYAAEEIGMNVAQVLRGFRDVTG